MSQHLTALMQIQFDNQCTSNYCINMKRLQNILRVTLMLAVTMAPLGGVYADIKSQSDMKSHCANMKMEDSESCPHHTGDNNQNSGMDMKCDKDCNDCKAASHVAGLAPCSMHSLHQNSSGNETSSSSPHACPHLNTAQPPKH